MFILARERESDCSLSKEALARYLWQNQGRKLWIWHVSIIWRVVFRAQHYRLSRKSIISSSFLFDRLRWIGGKLTNLAVHFVVCSGKSTAMRMVLD